MICHSNTLLIAEVFISKFIFFYQKKKKTNLSIRIRRYSFGRIFFSKKKILLKLSIVNLYDEWDQPLPFPRIWLSVPLFTLLELDFEIVKISIQIIQYNYSRLFHINLNENFSSSKYWIINVRKEEEKKNFINLSYDN